MLLSLHRKSIKFKTMKLTTEQFESLRSSVESMVSGLVEGVINDTQDEYFRDETMDMLSDEDFTEVEFDEIREIWNDVENESGIDNTLYVNFIEDIVNSIMSKYK